MIRSETLAMSEPKHFDHVDIKTLKQFAAIYSFRFIADLQMLGKIHISKNIWYHSNCAQTKIGKSYTAKTHQICIKAFGINEHIETYASVDDNYSIFVFLIVIIFRRFVR